MGVDVTKIEHLRSKDRGMDVGRHTTRPVSPAFRTDGYRIPLASQRARSRQTEENPAFSLTARRPAVLIRALWSPLPKTRA
jgi:hypothetical protein